MIIWTEDGWREDGADLGHDRGFALGDGLFETLAFQAGQIVRKDAHLARLQASAQALGLPLPEFDLQRGAQILADQFESTDLALRLSVTAGTGPRGLLRPEPVHPVLVMSAAPLAAAPDAISLQIVSVRRSSAAVSSHHKTLSYIDNVIARREAVQAGADMALMRDDDGNLACADCANILWSDGAQIYTPALNGAVLPGTVRAVLVEKVAIVEAKLGPGDLDQARSAFVTNALMGIVPVSSVNNRTLDGDPDLLARLRAAIA